MANRNVTQSVTRSQFLKDQISTKERLLICGIDCIVKNNPVTQYRSARKNSEAYRVFFKRSKTVMA